MGWQTTLSNQLKYLLDDTDVDGKYDNIRLSKFIAIAATQVVNDLFLTNYTIDTEEPSITPDPTNERLAPLLVMKAAEIVVRQEYKMMILRGGFSISDDRSSFSGAVAVNALKDLMNSYKQKYDEMKKAYQLGAGNIGIGIFSPFTE